MAKSTKANVSAETVTRTITSIKNVIIFDTPLSLLADKISTTYEIVRKVNADTGRVFRNLSKHKISDVEEKLYLPLEKTTAEYLSCLRKQSIPFFVLKKEENLFYSLLPKDITSSQITFSCNHMCSTCERLSAASDENGGCAKVRNHASKIEYYPWISGYEIAGTTHNSFIVLECKQYERWHPRTKRSLKEKINIIAAISEYNYPDIIFNSF